MGWWVGGDECYRRNPPGGRSGRGATSNLVCLPKTTPTKGKQTIKNKIKGVTGEITLVADPDEEPLKFSQIAPNNPNKKQTKKPSVTGEIALEADPDEKPPQTQSDCPKQPNKKQRSQQTKNRV